MCGSFDEKIIRGGPVGVRGPAVTADGGKTWSYPCDGTSTKSTFSGNWSLAPFYDFTWSEGPNGWQTLSVAGEGANPTQSDLDRLRVEVFSS